MVMTTEVAHRLHQKFPRKHNHYGLRDYFQFNQEEGTITDWNDVRNILTSEDFIIGLLEGLEEEVGEASAAIMYSIGLEWGKQDSLFFESWFEKEFGMSARTG
jgi:predicted hydrocarbon binding protein